MSALHLAESEFGDSTVKSLIKPIPFTSIRLVVFVSLAVMVLGAVMLSKTVEVCIGQLLGLSEKNEILKFLGIGFGGILLVWQAVIANKRAKAMEETAKAQAKATEEQAKANQNAEQGQRQERLKNAIEHLGHDSDLVRLGGAYELFHLAQDTPDLRQTILDILCAHIRRTTGEAEYPGRYASRPSQEVQSLLTLLFVEEHEVFKECRINLQGSRLYGVNLTQSRLQGANLVEADLQRADLVKAKLQGAKLVKAYLQDAELREAHLHGAQLEKAHLQEAFLERACLHGANLEKADLRMAYLFRTQLQGASFVEAGLQGAMLEGAYLQGAHFWQAHLQGAKLNRAHLQGIHCEDSAISFPERIRGQIGKESESDIAIFEGGLSPVDVDSLTDRLSNDKLLRERLRKHIGKEESYQLPEDSGAITGAYTEEEAEQWIAEYEEAMAEVPKAENGQ